jgi:hypothetical protein
MHILEGADGLYFIVRHITVALNTVGPFVRLKIKIDMMEVAFYSLLFQNAVSKVVFDPLAAIEDGFLKRRGLLRLFRLRFYDG